MRGAPAAIWRNLRQAWSRGPRNGPDARPADPPPAAVAGIRHAAPGCSARPAQVDHPHLPGCHADG